MRAARAACNKVNPKTSKPQTLMRGARAVSQRSKP